MVSKQHTTSLSRPDTATAPHAEDPGPYPSSTPSHERIPGIPPPEITNKLTSRLHQPTNRPAPLPPDTLPRKQLALAKRTLPPPPRTARHNAPCRAPWITSDTRTPPRWPPSPDLRTPGAKPVHHTTSSEAGGTYSAEPCQALCAGRSLGAVYQTPVTMTTAVV